MNYRKVQFCPHCGTFLSRDEYGDITCSKCDFVLYEKPKIDLTKVSNHRINNEKISSIVTQLQKHEEGELIFDIDRGILERDSKPNRDAQKGVFNQLLERFGIELSLGYERSQGNRPRDVSSVIGIGYDIISNTREESRIKRIEVKTSFDSNPDINLTENEYEFLLSKSQDKWIYTVLLDQKTLYEANYLTSFKLYRIPCQNIRKEDCVRSFFSENTINEEVWKKVAQSEVLIPSDDLQKLLISIVRVHSKLFNRKPRSSYKKANEIVIKRAFNGGYSEPGRKFYRKRGSLSPDEFIVRYHRTLVEQIIHSICIEKIREWDAIRKHLGISDNELNTHLSLMYDEKVLERHHGKYDIVEPFKQVYLMADWDEIEKKYIDSLGFS